MTSPLIQLAERVAPLLSELREPPVVGRFYMVPTVRYVWRDRLSDWPVLGGLHHDRQHIGFNNLHYHFDGRFLTARQLRYIRQVGGELWEREGYALNANVVSEPDDEYWLRTKGPIPRKPTLAKRKCLRRIQPWVVGDKSAQWGLAKVYGDPAEPIRRPDGRLLCPHRKADLSQITPDENGIVTCPLHGLRVRCQAIASQEQAK